MLTWPRASAPGDRVGAYGHNSDAYLIGFLACSRAGLVHVPVNQNLTGDDLAYIVGQSGSSLVLADPDLADRLPDGVRTMPLRDADDSLLARLDVGTRRTTVPSRAPRTWCSCSTPPARPPCPRAR